MSQDKTPQYAVLNLTQDGTDARLASSLDEAKEIAKEIAMDGRDAFIYKLVLKASPKEGYVRVKKNVGATFVGPDKSTGGPAYAHYF